MHRLKNNGKFESAERLKTSRIISIVVELLKIVQMPSNEKDLGFTEVLFFFIIDFGSRAFKMTNASDKWDK